MREQDVRSDKTSAYIKMYEQYKEAVDATVEAQETLRKEVIETADTYCDQVIRIGEEERDKYNDEMKCQLDEFKRKLNDLTVEKITHTTEE